MRLRSGTRSQPRGPGDAGGETAGGQRRMLGLAVLAVGWVVALAHLAAETPPSDPKYVSPPAAYEAEFLKIRPYAGYPSRGVIGYRDEVHPDTPENRSVRTQLHLIYQFILAPVLLDRTGNYESTLVRTRTGPRHERTGGKP